jgi:hypothetical protein
VAAADVIEIVNLMKWLAGCLLAVLALVGNAIVLGGSHCEHAVLQTLGFEAGWWRLIVSEGS